MLGNHLYIIFPHKARGGGGGGGGGVQAPVDNDHSRLG